MAKFTPLSTGGLPALSDPALKRLRSAALRANPLGKTKRGKRGGWVSASGKGKYEHKRIRPPGHFDESSFRTVPWSFISNSDEKAFVLKKLGKRTLPAGIKVITGRFLASTTRGRVKGKRVKHLGTGVQAVLFPLPKSKTRANPRKNHHKTKPGRGKYAALCVKIYGPVKDRQKGVRLNPATGRRAQLRAAVERQGFEQLYATLENAKQFAISRGQLGVANAIQRDMDYAYNHWAITSARAKGAAKQAAQQRATETRKHAEAARKKTKAAQQALEAKARQQRHDYLIDWARRSARRNPEIKIDLSPKRLEVWAKKYKYQLLASAHDRRQGLRQSIGDLGFDKTWAKLITAAWLVHKQDKVVGKAKTALKSDDAWMQKEQKASAKKRRAAKGTKRSSGPSKYLTLAAAAKKLGVKQATVKNYIRQGKLRAFKDGTKIKIREADLVRKNPGRLLILNPGHKKAKAVKGSFSKIVQETAKGMKPKTRKAFLKMVSECDAKERKLLDAALRRYKKLHNKFPDQLTKTKVKMPGKGKRFMVGIGKADHVGYHANKDYKGSSKKGTPFRHHFENGQELVTDESGKSLAVVGTGTRVTNWIYG